jgi:hypothetical protein
MVRTQKHGQIGHAFSVPVFYYSLLLNVEPNRGGSVGFFYYLILSVDNYFPRELKRNQEKPSYFNLYDSTDLRKRCFSSGTSRLARAVSTLSFLKNFGLNSI